MNDILFTPFHIGNMELRNRVIMAPMGAMAAPDGGFSATVRDYLTARAKGGCAMIISGALMPTDFFGKPGSGRFHLPEHGEKARLLADAIHAAGAKLCLQFGFGNGRYGGADPNNPPWSASAIPTFQHPEVACRELSKENIAAIVADTGRAAALAKASGVDAIELHAYAGYLLDQFQSSEWNKRSDEYGGGINNRLRFTGQLINAIKESCGADFPVLVKFSVTHGTASGRQLDEGLAMCRKLEHLGADALQIDSGSFETLWNRCLPTVYEEDGFSLPFAKAAREAVTIPVIAQNKLSRPEIAARALEDGCCDLVALGHGLLADADWVNKAAAGQPESIRPCLGCNECFRCIATGKTYTCAVNPQLSHETDSEWMISKAAQPRRVLVVGGGPAGVRAAVWAAERGHMVELWEADSHIGGNLSAAAAPEFKSDMKRHLQWLEWLLANSEVRVVLNKRATAADIQAAGFDKVIVAAGAGDKTLPIPVADGVPVWAATELLQAPELPGQNIAIIGGGLVGVETALSMEQRGAQVSVIESLPGLLQTANEPRNNSLALQTRLAKSHIKAICGAQVTAIDREGVHYTQGNESGCVPADAVAMAVGLEPSGLGAELRALGVDAVDIGDCLSPRKVLDAVREAFIAARDI